MALDGRSRRNRNRSSRRVVALHAPFNKVRETTLTTSVDGAATWSTVLDTFEGIGQIPLMTVHKSKGLEYDTIVFVGLDDQAWWAHRPGNPEGLATFFVALSRAKQRAIFAFCRERGQRQRVAELFQLLTDAGVPEIAI